MFVACGRPSRIPRDWHGYDISVSTAADLVLSKLRWAKDSHSNMQFADVRTIVAPEAFDEPDAYFQRWLGRIQRRIDAFLDQAEAASDEGGWASVAARVRAGQVLVSARRYDSLAVERAARIASQASGGQIFVAGSSANSSAASPSPSTTAARSS